MSAKGINIYNLCYNALVLKKIGKTFQKCSFRTLYRQKHGPGQKSSSIFFSENRKEDRKHSRTFHFIKMSKVLTESWMIFCLVGYFAVTQGMRYKLISGVHINYY